MPIRYSERTSAVKASEVRELLKLCEKKDMISFGGGLPAEESFPVAEMEKICREILLTEGAKSMQYATSEGYIELRKLIVGLMAEKNISADTDQILVTTGSQQGLDLTAKVFIDPGDIILCERPTYLSAINAFKPFYPQFIDIPMDHNGMLLDSLEEKLRSYPSIRFLYTIPDYQNPTGVTLSLERRHRLMELANRYDILIIEDNPYSEVNFNGQILPSLKSLDTEERVIYLSTFSKTVCPGFRIGWVCAAKEILQKYILFKQGTDLHTNIFAQMQIAKFFQQYDIKSHLQRNILCYKKRRDVMLRAMEKEFPPEVHYTRPEGGMFIWVELPSYLNSRELLTKALAQGVAFVPGGAFYPNGGSENTFRLNFSGLPEEQIEEGIARLGKVLSQHL